MGFTCNRRSVALVCTPGSGEWDVVFVACEADPRIGVADFLIFFFFLGGGRDEGYTNI